MNSTTNAGPDLTATDRDDKIIALLHMRKQLRHQMSVGLRGFVTLKREFYGAVEIDADVWQVALDQQLRRVEATLAAVGVKP
jgi:hypothetical protein